MDTKFHVMCEVDYSDGRKAEVIVVELEATSKKRASTAALNHLKKTYPSGKVIQCSALNDKGYPIRKKFRARLQERRPLYKSVIVTPPTSTYNNNKNYNNNNSTGYSRYYTPKKSLITEEVAEACLVEADDL